MLLGMGLFTTIGVHTPIGVLAVFQIIQGVGMGTLYCTYVRPPPFFFFFLLSEVTTTSNSSPSWPHSPSNKTQAQSHSSRSYVRLLKYVLSFPLHTPISYSLFFSFLSFFIFIFIFILKKGVGRRYLWYDPPKRTIDAPPRVGAQLVPAV